MCVLWSRPVSRLFTCPVASHRLGFVEDTSLSLNSGWTFILGVSYLGWVPVPALPASLEWAARVSCAIEHTAAIGQADLQDTAQALQDLD